MENKIVALADAFPTLIKNTTLNVSLQGWPATVTFVGLGCVAVVGYAIKVLSRNNEAPVIQGVA